MRNEGYFKIGIITAVALAGMLLWLNSSGNTREQEFDLILRGGRVVDGSGSPWYRADVGIQKGRITAVGDLATAQAPRIVEVSDRYVAPGFIDMMGQSSLRLVTDPKSALSKLYQGITTMLSGESSTPAPQTELTQPEGVQIGERRYSWRTYGEYFRILEEHGVALNLVHNVGGTQLRLAVIGDQDKPLTVEGLNRMKSLTEQAMRDGALGLSTALIYPPGAFATTEELVALAGVVARHNGLYLSHVRNESSRVVEAIEEAIKIGREAGLPVHIYHLKAAGRENWPLMDKALESIRAARRDGVDVTADIYPYVRNGLLLEAFIPPRYFRDGTEKFVATLESPDVRRAIRRELETTSDWENWYRHVGQDWGNVLIDRVGGNSEAECVGESVEEVALRRGVDPWQAFFDLIRERGVHVVPLSQDEEQKRKALRSPFVMIDTDASPTNPDRESSAHPRAFGAFPRILAKYVREEGVLGLEEAVHKMTALPANRLQLYDRGRIAPGLAADLVVFELDKVRDRATFVDPLQYAEGMDYVIVNGVFVIDDGRPTRTLPGRVLRHKSPGRE